MKIGLGLICIGFFFGIANPDRFFSAFFFIGIWGVLFIWLDYSKKHGKSYEERGPIARKLSDLFGIVMMVVLALALLLGLFSFIGGGCDGSNSIDIEGYRR